jgi:peptidase family M20/M25/M40
VIIGPGDLAVVHRENEHIKLSQVYQAARLYLSMMLTF